MSYYNSACVKKIFVPPFEFKYNFSIQQTNEKALRIYTYRKKSYRTEGETKKRRDKIPKTASEMERAENYPYIVRSYCSLHNHRSRTAVYCVSGAAAFVAATAAAAAVAIAKVQQTKKRQIGKKRQHTRDLIPTYTIIHICVSSGRITHSQF